MSAMFAAVAITTLGLSVISAVFCVAAIRMGLMDACRHNEYQAIGWAAVSALFFIASRLP